VDNVNGISYYLSKCRRYKTHHSSQFFFQEDSALVHCAYSTVQLLQRYRLIQHLSENVIFVSPFCHFFSAESRVIWGGIMVKHLLIAYIIGNISAKNNENLFMCVKVTANHIGGAFLRHGVCLLHCWLWYVLTLSARALIAVVQGGGTRPQYLDGSGLALSRVSCHPPIFDESTQVTISIPFNHNVPVALWSLMKFGLSLHFHYNIPIVSCSIVKSRMAYLSGAGL